MSLLDLWRQFVGMGYASEMTPDLRLRFWKDRSRDYTGTVIFRQGKHIRGEVTRDPQDAGLRTRILVQGDGGRFFEVSDPTLEGDAYIGRREGYLSFTASTEPTTLQQVGTTRSRRSRSPPTRSPSRSTTASRTATTSRSPTTATAIGSRSTSRHLHA